jgi:hypothetical protein
MLVVAQNDVAVGIGDRDDGPVEVPVAHRDRRLALAFDGECVDVLAREALDGCDQVRRNSLRHRGSARAGQGSRRRSSPILRSGSTATSIRRRLRQPDPGAAADAHRPDGDRLLAGTTEAVQGHSRHRLRPPASSSASRAMSSP